MNANYFSITIYIKDRSKVLKGIRIYETDSYDVVYQIVLKELLKFYYLNDILKIDVWLLSENSVQVKEFLERKSNTNNNTPTKSKNDQQQFPSI